MEHYNGIFFSSFFQREARTTPFATGTADSFVVRRSGYTLQLKICTIDGIYHLDYRYGATGGIAKGGVIIIDRRITGYTKSESALNQAIAWITQRNEDADSPFPLDLLFDGQSTIYGDNILEALPEAESDPIETAGLPVGSGNVQPMIIGSGFYLSIGSAYPLLYSQVTEMILTPIFSIIPQVSGSSLSGGILTRIAGTANGTITGEWWKNGSATGIATSAYSSTVEGDLVFWKSTAINDAGTGTRSSNMVAVTAVALPISQ